MKTFPARTIAFCCCSTILPMGLCASAHASTIPAWFANGEEAGIVRNVPSGDINPFSHLPQPDLALVLLETNTSQPPWAASSVDDCQHIADEEDLIRFGGGNADENVSGGSAAGFASANESDGSGSTVSMDPLVFPGGMAGGGSGTGGAGTFPGSNTGGQSAGGGPSQSNGLGDWNVVQVGDDQAIDSSSGTNADTEAAVASMPLPASVWMSIGGLAIVVLLRRRIMP